MYKRQNFFFNEHRATDTLLLRDLKINDEKVEKVDNFKYLGTVLDRGLKFKHHVDFIVKKANQRMYLIRKLKSFSVECPVLEMAYRSLVQSILSFNIVTWYGQIDVKDKARLNRIVNIASKVIGINQPSLSNIYHDFIKRKAHKILADDSHPMYNVFELLPSGVRYRSRVCKRNLHRFSFTPSAIRILNYDKR